MPYLSEYVDVEVDINVSPTEFIEHCSEKEIEELIGNLRSEGYFEEDKSPSSHPIANEFYQNIDKIKQNRLALTSEEEEVLYKIASRF